MTDWHGIPVRTDFAAFIAKTIGTTNPGADYMPNWHIELIAQYLEAARRGEINRLIINLPPRSLKSTCVSVAWPAWILGHDPKSRLIATSYAASLSIKHSLDCRLVVSSPWYRLLFPQTRIAKDQNEKHKFMTHSRGYRLATSVGGSTTGEGGNFLIIDDPMNPQQAMNSVWRNYTNEWFNHTFSTRLDDKRKGVIVLVMQRLHPQDLSGYLLAKGGWQQLMLPAIDQKEERYRFTNVDKIRKSGELLHAAREDAELVERAKIELGSSAFSAQYQQKPLADDNPMIRIAWFGRYDVIPQNLEGYTQSWDTAIKSEAKHDASVCITFGEALGKIYVLEVRSFRYEYPDLKRALFAMAEQWNPSAILIEDKASGQQLLQDARRETALPVIAGKARGSKLIRFAAISAMIEGGKVLLPRHAPWLADFEAELSGFPHSLHDDQVDAFTQYLEWMRKKSWDKLGLRGI